MHKRPIPVPTAVASTTCSAFPRERSSQQTPKLAEVLEVLFLDELPLAAVNLSRLD
jgi:hypothetical protein